MPRDFQNHPQVEVESDFDSPFRIPNLIQDEQNLVKQRVYALIVTIGIIVGGVILNHAIKIKYDIKYILSQKRSDISIHVPRWGSDEVFLGTIHLILGSLASNK